MSKYLRNNIKLLAIAGIMAGVLVFSPVLSALALAEGTEVAEVSSTTEGTATTEVTTTTEATAVATATDDDSDAEAVGSYMGADGIMREIHVSVSTDGGTYNGKDYIPPTISDDFKSVSFSSNVQREGYTLVGFSTGYFLQEEVNNATPDMSKPYTIDESGNVHMNLDDIVAWSITDNIDTNTITSLYHLTTLWAPNPEPEPEPEPQPEPEPAPAPVAPASDSVQQPAPRREKSVLPNTGDASSVAGIVAAAGTTLVALGLRKKMQ
ncbi:MAG: LPXTG cell wall anchor domain-containing protein [Atopobium sp.]|nr:LPXTG cell wall anchor domain-containing protein [Atopobium sp.]